MTRMYVGAAGAIAVCLLGTMLVLAEDKKEPTEGERSVKQGEVPAAALATLKKLAGDASFTEFAEEVERGKKFYEGSWKGLNGNVDALVTEDGTIVEIEESLPTTAIPAAVRAAAAKEAGEGATFERKTLYLYEIHFKKDGKEQELIFTADARSYDEEEMTEDKVDDEDDDDDNDGDK